MDINISCKSITVEAKNAYHINAEISGVEVNDILDHISLADAIGYYGASKLLDEIGEDEAIKHFEIEVKEE